MPQTLDAHYNLSPAITSHPPFQPLDTPLQPLTRHYNLSMPHYNLSPAITTSHQPLQPLTGHYNLSMPHYNLSMFHYNLSPAITTSRGPFPPPHRPLPPSPRPLPPSSLRRPKETEGEGLRPAAAAVAQRAPTQLHVHAPAPCPHIFLIAALNCVLSVFHKWLSCVQTPALLTPLTASSQGHASRCLGPKHLAHASVYPGEILSPLRSRSVSEQELE